MGLPGIHTANAIANFYYPDRSGFQFDLSPQMVTWGWGFLKSGGIYEIPTLPAWPTTVAYMGWTQWIDKFQKDWRFNNVSDDNASTNIWPETYSPWMFTEYVFKGTKTSSSLDNTDTAVSLIVTPPVADPTKVTRAVTLMGGISSSVPSFFNPTDTTFYKNEQKVVYVLEDQWQSTETSKLFWESELSVVGWVEYTPSGSENRMFTRTGTQRRVASYAVPTLNSGVRMNKQPVWARAERWGQSQNIPPRILNLTAPAEYISPAGMFTGRIVPHVVVHLGTPIYDTISAASATTGDTRIIRQDGIVIGLWNNGAQVNLWPAAPLTLDSGSIAGTPDAVYNYSYPSGINDWPLTSSPVPLPKRILSQHDPQYKFTETDFANTDLIHHGCEFWQGTLGKAKCSYTVKFSALFGVLADTQITYNSAGTSVSFIDLPFTISTPNENVEVLFQSENYSTWTNIVDVYSAVVDVITTGVNVSTRIKVSLSGSPIKPDADVSSGGLVSGPGAWAKFWIRKRSINRPVPDPGLCAMFDDSDPGAKANYTNAGGKCPFYSPHGPRILLAYEGVAANGAEWANLQLGLPSNYKRGPWTDIANDMMNLAIGTDAVFGTMGLATMSAFSILAMNAARAPDPFTSGLPQQQTTTVDISFEPEMVAITGKKPYYATYDGLPHGSDPESSIRIDPTTGFNVLDEKSNAPFSGVDTPFFGMVNQINYRIMSNVQHCYKQQNCDPIITTTRSDRGFVRGRFSNLNFIGHPLTMPGYPAYDGSSVYCYTGNQYCPYNKLDRRAAEYNENYKILLTEILGPFRAGGMAAFDRLQEGFLVGDTIHFNLSISDLVNNSMYASAMCAAVEVDTGHPTLLGHYQPIASGTDGYNYRIYFFYDRPTWDPGHRTASHVFAHLIQFDDTNNPCYMPNTIGSSGVLNKLYGDYTKVPWLVELHDNYKEPQGNVVQVTNALPFAGGRHPEYKNQQLRGRQIVSPWGGYSSTGGVPADMQVPDQFGGTQASQMEAGTVGTRGYWTEKEGEFIMDGGPIGDLPMPVFPTPAPSGTLLPAGFVAPGERISNHPGIVRGATPIHGVPGLTITDPSNPDMDRKGDFALMGATYSNDTKELIEWFSEIVGTEVDPVTQLVRGVTRWKQMLPTYTNQDGDQEVVPVGPPLVSTSMLPRERYMYRCQVCGIEFEEEEVNYFKQFTVFTAANPSGIVPTPYGIWCPRFDGGIVVSPPVASGLYGTLPSGMTLPPDASGSTFDRFPDTKARGNVDFWAPPGTTVRTDAFFWKNPTMVNRLHQDQITQKLGQYNSSGGGYNFNTLSASTEILGKLPTAIGSAYQPGLMNQLVAPWASGGMVLSDLRSKVGIWFHLGEADPLGQHDIAYVNRFGQAGSIRVPQSAEALFTLNLGDLVTYYREMPNGDLNMVGVTVAAANSPPASFLADPFVAAGILPPPDANNFNVTTTYGFKEYELAMRQWLLGSASGTAQQFASCITMPQNALALQLQSMGLDPLAAYPYSPGNHPGMPPIGQGAGPMPLDERIIAPYTTTESGGLELVTINHMKRLRNRILPILAYDLSSNDQYKANGDYTSTKQASNMNRFSIVDRGYPFQRFGSIDPQVLAATQSGLDFYVQWVENDVLGTRRRAYYPVGSSWWRANAKIGQIVRHGGTNPLHLDDTTKTDPIKWPQNVYTGDVITSACAYFLHGRIPMDKEVVKAYVVFKTDPNGPSAAAIGCRGKYDGWEGQLGRDGNIRQDTLVYRGNSECFWQHFHPWTTTHETDTGSWGDPTGESVWDASNNGGPKSRQHWLDFGDGSIGAHGWDPGSITVYSDQQSPITPCTLNMEGNFQRSGYVPWMAGDPGNSPYYAQVAMLGMNFYDDTCGFDFGQPFLGPWSWGENIQQLVTEHECWKEITYQNYLDTEAKLSCTVTAAANTTGAQVSFKYYAPHFRNLVYPREHQGIPSWLNYANYDNSGNFQEPVIEPKQFDYSWADGPQVIVQAEDQLNGDLDLYNGLGDEERVVDVTTVIQDLYNSRVPRFYHMQLGHSYDELYDFMRSKTDTNIVTPDVPGLTHNGLALRFHDNAQGGGAWKPLYMWNYRYFTTDGMWLNDPWHHPELSNGSPVAAPLGGDPIPQTTDDRMARVEMVDNWDNQGFDSSNPAYFQYHPIALCSGTIAWDDTLGAPSAPTPGSYQATNYWRCYNNTLGTHFFTMDLRQTPYENMRRPWRYLRPSVDSSSATCPNPSCLVHQNGWTVAQFFNNSISVWGLNVIPSTTSPNCGFCGTALVGVIYSNGDNVTTASYDATEQPDAIITRLDIDTKPYDSWRPTAKHGFLIEYYNSVAQQWRQLFEVLYDPGSDTYTWLQWSGTAWVWQTGNQSALPTTWKGAEGGAPTGGVIPPKNPSAATGSHFISVAAEKIRFKVLDSAKVEMYEPSNSTYLSCTPNTTNNTLFVTSLMEDYTKYAGRDVKILTTGNAVVNRKVLSVSQVTTPSVGFAIQVDGAVFSSYTQCQLHWNEYVTRCTRFLVYGYPYRAGEVTITPPGYMQPMIFSEGTNTFVLNSWPTQITKVTCGAGDRSAIPVTEHDTGTGSDWCWTVKQVTVNGLTYYTVQSGRWFYDYNSNAVIIPTSCVDQNGTQLMDPENNTPLTIWGLNLALYKANLLTTQTVPSMLNIWYFTGIGLPVKSSVMALGVGPSYQLDKECVCFIAGHTMVNGVLDNEPLPVGVTSDPIAYPGFSVRMKQASTSDHRVQLQWHVYNHDPILWTPTIGWVAGNELGPGAWGDNDVMDIFTGKGHGVNVSECGGGVIAGYATGQVTLYGPPETILSGHHMVYAKAVTQRTYNLPDSTVTTYERTGGYKSGAMVFRLTIQDTGFIGRKSVSASVPSLLVFLKERDLTASV